MICREKKSREFIDRKTANESEREIKEKKKERERENKEKGTHSKSSR